MRDGVNPEKFKKEENKRYAHRVVVPIYVPDIEQEYYSYMAEILSQCLDSLIDTINTAATAITIINNNSTSAINTVINDRASSFDKIINYSENKGKVYPLLQEARGCYEPFITFVDSDVFFIKGWEKAVFSIFKTYKNTGVVAPLPSPGLAFNHNNTLFFDKSITRAIDYGKIIEDEDLELYLKGLGNDSLFNRNNRTKSWKQAHYFLNKEPKAIVGAGHFVATYKSEIFKNQNSFPVLKFINGYEDAFIDILADKKGGYRLSTTKSFAYHVGNKMDETIAQLKSIKGDKISDTFIWSIDPSIKKRLSPYSIRKFVFKAIKKIKKL